MSSPPAVLSRYTASIGSWADASDTPPTTPERQQPQSTVCLPVPATPRSSPMTGPQDSPEGSIQPVDDFTTVQPGRKREPRRQCDIVVFSNAVSAPRLEMRGTVSTLGELMRFVADRRYLTFHGYDPELKKVFFRENPGDKRLVDADASEEYVVRAGKAIAARGTQAWRRAG